MNNATFSGRLIPTTTRRAFLQRVTWATVVALTAPLVVTARVLGADGTVEPCLSARLIGRAVPSPPPRRLPKRRGLRRGVVRGCIERLGLWLSLAVTCFVASAAADRLILTLGPPSNAGLVVVRVDLTEAARWCGVEVAPERLRAFAVPGDRPVPAQFVANEGNTTEGTLVLHGDPTRPLNRVRLDFAGSAKSRGAGSTTVQTHWYSVTHDPKRLGGLPSEIRFAENGATFPGIYWNDRLYHRKDGQFWLRHDREPRVVRVSTGPVCTVVRVVARHTQPDGKQPDSQPSAIYDWYYFHHQPLVFVRGVISQREVRTWHEAHFLELGFPTNGFSHWAGGEPAQAALFQGNDQSHRFSRWGAVIEGRNAIAMFDGGTVIAYDGVGFGRYLLAQADAAWQDWGTREFEREAWLWLGSDAKPADVVAKIAANPPGKAQSTISTERLQRRLDRLQARLASAEDVARREAGLGLAVARLLQKQGRLREALELPAGQLPAGWAVIPAGDLQLILDRRQDGLMLLDLVDVKSGASLTGAGAGPIFEATLRNAQTGEEIQIASDQGWSDVTVAQEPGKEVFKLRWAKPQSSALGSLSFTARVRVDAARHRLAWSLAAQGQASPWSLWRIRFPQVVLSADSPASQLLLPQAAGVLKPVGRESLSRFPGQYPSGWMSMQLAALYDPATGTGLYFGLHDPIGSTKDFTAETVSEHRAVRLTWDIPVPDMGKATNHFALSGEAVWQLLRGDWFDAALIYRDWARREAKWFPTLGTAGRADTPPWMRELSAWAMTGGGPKDCVPRVLEFAQALGVTVGFHWYNWHQIPFDNDYPHYFPTKDGFIEGVKQLQADGVHVMPYINGRLWDTRDRGTNDYEFTSIAQPAAARRTNGEPYIEAYGSKESDGTDVRLAVMCPTTSTWRDKQHDIVTRLFNECGVHGVYIDQIAAAKPELCFDASHGHPLGGGSWWNDQGYWLLLERIRGSKPRDRMLTTECNAEPYLRWMDGYLTWHWQYQDQVPLFPAVYGGVVQMFGRAYRGGPTKDLALRMKAAQQLVWGEQLGWLDPTLVREPDNFAFFRNAVQLRSKLRRYFHAGQMARPPKLTGEIPTVTADWQWSGVWPVTTPALMTGAWHLPSEQRAVLLFANVSDEALTATVQCNLREAGLTTSSLSRRKWTPQNGPEMPTAVRPVLRETVTFPPRSAWAWEIGTDL